MSQTVDGKRIVAVGVQVLVKFGRACAGGLMLSLILAGCRQSSHSTSGDAVPPQAGPAADPPLVEPHRYWRAGDLAAAIRNEGYACERVRSHRQLERNGKLINAYKVDCLEYSYQLTLTNGGGEIKRWNDRKAGVREP